MVESFQVIWKFFEDVQTLFTLSKSFCLKKCFLYQILSLYIMAKPS